MSSDTVDGYAAHLAAVQLRGGPVDVLHEVPGDLGVIVDKNPVSAYAFEMIGILGVEQPGVLPEAENVSYVPSPFPSFRDDGGC
jgi:hypothetical protein